MSTPRSLASQIAVTAASITDDARRAPGLARSLGFSGLLFAGFSPSLDITDLSGSGRREFRHMISASNVRLVGLTADLGAKGLGPGADVDRILARLDKLLEAAKGLESPLVCVDLGPLPPPPRDDRPKPKITAEMAGLLVLPDSSALVAVPAPESTNLSRIPPAVDPTFTAQVDAALADLGQRADRYGVTVALRSGLAGFGSLERALRAAHCPWFGVDLDPASMLGDEWRDDEIFSRLGPQVRHVRGHDASAGADHRTKPAIVGQGDTDWPLLLSHLDAAGYHGWITLDPFDLPDRAAAAGAGREWIVKAATA
jgi:sugar phosphate isomerase/epimerase